MGAVEAMIIPPGVLIPQEWCAETVKHLGRSLAIDRTTSPMLLRFVDELTAVASEVSDLDFRDSPIPAYGLETVGVTVKRYAAARNLSERRIRQMISEGKLQATQPGGPHTRWLIHNQQEDTL
jgi:hypothetical protein